MSEMVYGGSVPPYSIPLKETEVNGGVIDFRLSLSCAPGSTVEGAQRLRKEQVGRRGPSK